MSTIRRKTVYCTIAILLVCISIPATGNSSSVRSQSVLSTQQQADQRDSASRARLSTVDEMAKRVDSLQFIVVYNAQVLRRDLDSKVIWIYVMLGVMIVASMMMYGALSQAQRQRKDLEERLFNTLKSSTSDLEARIQKLEREIQSAFVPKRTPPHRKK